MKKVLLSVLLVCMVLLSVHAMAENPCEHIRDCTGTVCLNCGEEYYGDNVQHLAFCFEDTCEICGEPCQGNIHIHPCNSDICDYCGATCTPYNSDSYCPSNLRTYEYVNAEYHKYICTNCGREDSSVHSRYCDESVCMYCRGAYTGDDFWHRAFEGNPVFTPVINADGTSTIHKIFCTCGEDVSADFGLTYEESMHTIATTQGQAATCTEDGLTDGKFCDTCGYILEKQTVIPASGHAVVTDAGKAATCTEDGLTEGSHCSTCNAVLQEQTVIPAPGHTPVKDAGKAATCTEGGLTDGSHCSVCNTVLEAQTVIPATGHTPVKDAGKAATCNESGLTDGSHCSVCNTVLEAQSVIPATGHTIVNDRGYSATCTRPGLTYGSHCSVCGKTLERQATIPAKGHVFGEPEITPATCEANGLSKETCTVCGFVQETVLPATGHAYTDIYVSLNNGTHGAPCEHEGCGSYNIKNCEFIEKAVGNLLTKTCPVCGYTISEILNTFSEEPAGAIEQVIQNTLDSVVSEEPTEGKTALEDIQFVSEIKLETPVTIPSDKDDEKPGQTVTLVVYEQKIISKALEEDVPLHVYNVALVSNGETVEPKGIIKVELPCEEDEQEILKSMSLVLVLSDGTLMEIEFEVVDGKIVFETDAVGTIAFVDASLLKNQE